MFCIKRKREVGDEKNGNFLKRNRFRLYKSKKKREKKNEQKNVL